MGITLRGVNASDVLNALVGQNVKLDKITFDGNGVAVVGGQQLFTDGNGLHYTVNTTVHWESIQGVGGLNTQFAYTSTAGAGSNAFVASTAGARLKLSTSGTNDYFTSDNTTITCNTFFGLPTGLNITNDNYAGTSGHSVSVTGQQADGGSAIGVVLRSSTAYSTAGAKLVSLQNNATEKAFVDKDGGFTSLIAGGSKALTMNDLAQVAWSQTNIQGNGTQLFLNSNGATMLTVDRATPTVSTVAGSGLSTVNIIGQLNLNTSAAGNGADTTEDNLMSFSIPANTMTVTNRGFRVTAWGSGVSTTDVTTVRMYFGDPATLKSGTLLVSKVLTASQANTWHIVAEILRTGASAQVASAVFTNGGTAASLVQSNATPAGATAGAMLVGCTGQRATTSAANSLQQLGMIVEYL